MAEDRIHYWSGTDATFRRVCEAASKAGVLVSVWVGEAATERLEREYAEDEPRAQA